MNILRVQSPAFSSAYKIQPKLNYQTKIKSLDVDTVTFGSSEKHISKVIKTWQHPVKAVFSDIDGTILHDFKPVAGNLEAAKNLEKAGIPLILVTGRNRAEVQPMLDLLGIKRPDYLITEQGGTVFRGDEIIFKDTMSLKDTIAAIIYADAYIEQDENTQLFLHIDGQAYTTRKDLVANYSHAQDTVKWVSSFDELLQQGKLPTKAVLFKSDSTNIRDLDDARDFLEEKLIGRDLNVFNAARHFCEITNNSVSKGAAMRIVSDDLGMSLKNAAALGDAENDIEMIKMLSQDGGLSIAMGNAIPRLKTDAKAITDDVEKGGWALATGEILKNNANLLQ